MLSGQWHASDPCMLARMCESEDEHCFWSWPYLLHYLDSWVLPTGMLAEKLHIYIFFQSFVSRYVLPEREKRGAHASRGMGGGKEGEMEPGNKKEKEKSCGTEHIYSKNSLLSQSFSVFFLLLLRQRKKYDAGREDSLSLSLSQTFCWQTLPKNHFSLTMVCDSSCGWPQGWVTKRRKWAEDLPPLPMSLSPSIPAGIIRQ